MDVPLRAKLLLTLVSVVLLGGLLTTVSGSLLIKHMVVGEAERRMALALKTARAVLDSHLEGLRTSASVVAGSMAREIPWFPDGKQAFSLETLRQRIGSDVLQLVDAEGMVVRSARPKAVVPRPASSYVVDEALAMGQACAAIGLVHLMDLAADSPELVERARIEVVPTPRAKYGQPPELDKAMVMEAAAPIKTAGGRLLGAVRLMVVLNRNFGLVDFIRDSIFAMGSYRGKSLGTVTLFQRDVRIATNVTDPGGRRAVGTRVSAEVFDWVLGEGKVWRGPAFVVDSWYISSYEPIRDAREKIIGMLYVGVLKQRYNDMRGWALAVFLGVSLLALGGAVLLSSALAGQIARPITRLTAAATKVAQGNLNQDLPVPRQARRDEMSRLTLAFNKMVIALRERDQALQRSHLELRRTTEEIRRWNENYLDTLEFITHELKNQIAAMKLNLLALHDGYVGDMTPPQFEALGDVLAGVNRAEEMILNYLNLSRIEKGELQVRARPVLVDAEVMQSVLRDLRGRFEAKSMRVENELPTDLVVYADPSLLQVVYENLLGNAVKYGREEGLVRVWAKQGEAYVELHVWNDGPGVPADQMAQLFRKFSRVHESVAEWGTGLGLFVAREIVARHGGDLRVEGEYGAWIDLIVRLPRSDVLPEELPYGEL